MHRTLLSIILVVGSIGIAAAQTPPAKCLESQRRLFTEWLSRAPNPVPPTQQPVVSSREQLEVVCLPNNQQAYIISRGVQPPAIMSDESPDDAVRVATNNGQIPMVIRINEKGIPTSVLLVKEDGKSTGLDLSAHFKDWRFSPATYKGEAVPAVFKLKVQFSEPQ